MEKIKLIVCFLLCLLLCSCGHSVIRVDRGTGISARIPLPDGSSLIQFRAGKIDSVTGVLKGNTMMDVPSSTVGGLSETAGDACRVMVKTAPQLNEGYLAQILQDPSVDQKTKQLLSYYLISKKAPETTDSKTVTMGAASGTGYGLFDLSPKTTGFDNIVVKTSSTIKNISPIIKDGTVQVVNSTTKAVQNSVVDSTNNLKKNSDNIRIIVLAVVLASITITMLIYLIVAYKRKNQI